jgi:hypothetical protein
MENWKVENPKLKVKYGQWKMENKKWKWRGKIKSV